MDLNLNMEHEQTIRHPDLVDIELKYHILLPWLMPILREVQGLRDKIGGFEDTIAEYEEGTNSEIEELKIRVEELKDTDAINERVQYLEGILDKLNAEYDKDE